MKNRETEGHVSMMNEMFRNTADRVPSGNGGWKHAWKNVTFGFRQFLCFFVAMFVCQSFCWILIFSNATNNRRVYDTVRAEYDYHFAVGNLTETEAVYLSNAIVKANEAGMDYTVSFREENGAQTAYIVAGDLTVATGDTRRMYDAFLSVVLPLSGIEGSATGKTEDLDEAGHLPTVSPLMTCEKEYVLPNNLLSVLIAVPLAVVSALLLMFLYQIRLNDRKFMFGIYMAFGADFKRLFKGAVQELILLSALSLVPSFGFSVAVVALIYLPQGIPLALSLGQTVLFLLFNFAIVFLSVYLPTKRLSGTAPALLIASDDNAGLVTSPRRSFRIFGKTFPKHYELYGFARFRVYFARLLLSATLFAACFVCGFYICRMYDGATAGPVGQYRIEAPEFMDSEEQRTDVEDFVSTLQGIEGVSHAEWEVKSGATADRNFMMLRSENCRKATKYIVRTDEIVNTEEYTKAKYEQYVDAGYTAATNTYAYSLFTKEKIDDLCETCTVEGDPYKILTEKDHIILGESLFNRGVFRFEPGDTVVIGEIVSGSIPDEMFYFDDHTVLAEQLRICGIRFHVFTVAAVVKDDPAENHFLAGVSAEDYEYFTDDPAAPSEIELYIDRGLSTEEMDALDLQIRDALAVYTDTGYRLRETGAYLEERLRDERNSGTRTVVWSCLILVLSPLIWFFSQTLFFGRREKEFRILRAFGAYGEDIRGIHLWSGLFLGAAAAILALLEGLLCNYLLYAFCNYVLTGIGLIMGYRYTFTVSVFALVLAVLASFLFGFLSSYLPYLTYRKKRDAEERELLSAMENPSTDTGRGGEA